MSEWKKAERDDSEHTCRNCGYESCRNIVIKYGWHLDGWIEVIAGFAWRHVCARWLPMDSQTSNAE